MAHMHFLVKIVLFFQSRWFSISFATITITSPYTQLVILHSFLPSMSFIHTYA